MKKYDAIVVGSGPSGVISTQKLIDNKINTLLVDIGLEIDSEKKEIISNLKKRDYVNWKKIQTLPAESKIELNKKIFHEKYLYNLFYKKNFLRKNLLKDNSYSRSFEKRIDIDLTDVEYNPSLLKGGLSNLWGGSVLPLDLSNFEDWPIEYSDLKKYYQYTLDLIGGESYNDDINKKFPTQSGKEITNLKKCEHAQYIQHKYNNNKSKLNREGITIGYSRIAGERKTCIHCNECVLGSQNSAVYSSSDHLDRLNKNDFFHYKKNIIVEEIIERENEVKILCKDFNDKKIEFICDRLYLGAGYISTSKIILESHKHKNINISGIEARDSQYFILPAFLLKGFKYNIRENINSLSQLFIEINNNKISKKTSHLQIYTYNDLVEDYVEKKYPLLYKIIFPFIKNTLKNRIIFIQGYLHSDESTRARIENNKKDKLNNYIIRSLKNNNSKGTIKKIIKLLKLNFIRLGFYPISSFIQIGKFGAGHHSGGTFPMSKKSNKIASSNEWGIPFGFKKVHIIDSSILPNISPATITLTVMANAARIADNHKNY